MYKPGDLCFPHVLLVLSDINSFRSAYTVIFFIAIPFLFNSVVGNVIMLVCLWKCRSVHPPFKVLLRNLGISDLGVGLVVQPLFLVSQYTALIRDPDSFCVVYVIYSTVGYCFAAVFLYFYRYRRGQSDRNSTPHAISPVRYVKENILSNRFYLDFMSCYFMRVDLECHPSPDYQKCIFVFLHSRRFYFVYPGLYDGTSTSSWFR